jgi:ABC-type multidrug transport system ATPase subunit
VIEAIDLTVRRRGRAVLEAVSFDVRPGQVTGVLGGTGAGKTTLLRRMVQLDRGGGETLFDGRPYRALRHPMREVGLMLDQEAGHPDRTVRGHLRLALATDRRAAAPEARWRVRPGRRIDSVLDIAGLSGHGRTCLADLTDGMATRLAIAAALLGDPKALLLDCPDRGLEAEGADWLGDLLRAFTGQGRAALVTCSDTETLARLADRILLLDSGYLVGTRTAEEVLRAPTGSAVIVRSPQIMRFAALLAEAGARSTQGEGASLEVRGLDRARIGDLAYRHGVPLHELAERYTGADPADVVLAACSGRGRAVVPLQLATHLTSWSGASLGAGAGTGVAAGDETAVRLLGPVEIAARQADGDYGQPDAQFDAEATEPLGHDGIGHDGSEYEGSEFDRSGRDGSEFDGSEFDGREFDGREYEGGAHDGGEHFGSAASEYHEKAEADA